MLCDDEFLLSYLLKSTAVPLHQQKKAKAKAAADAVFAAVSAGDTKGVKEAYKAFTTSVELPSLGYEGKTKEYSQGYSTEYDWKAYTNKGTIYIR